MSLTMPPDDDFASLMEASLLDSGSRASRRLTTGEVVEGKIIQITADCVFVDIGTTGDARIERSEFEDESGQIEIAVGQRIRATVVKPKVSSPVLTLSLGRGGSVDLTALRAALESGAAVSGTVQKAVKAGLEVDLNGTRAFCPASQVELGYAADLSAFEGQTFDFRVLEIREGGRSIVVSRRALLEQERRERERSLVEKLSVDAEVDGVVHSTQRHGAVIDLGGIEGFCHISEIAHHRVENVEDELSIGQKVRASVLSIEETGRGVRVRLSIKALVQAPARAAPPAPDEVLTGTVSRLSTFGVFVETTRGEGLVPARELDLPPGSDHRRAFPVGKAVQVVLLSQDAGSGKLRFSISGVAQVEERKNYRDFAAHGAPATESSGFGNLGDVFRQRLGLPEPPPSSPPKPAEPAPQPVAPVAAAAPAPPVEPPKPPREPPRAPPPRDEPKPRRPDPFGVVRGRRKR